MQNSRWILIYRQSSNHSLIPGVIAFRRIATSEFKWRFPRRWAINSDDNKPLEIQGSWFIRVMQLVLTCSINLASNCSSKQIETTRIVLLRRAAVWKAGLTELCLASPIFLLNYNYQKRRCSTELLGKLIPIFWDWIKPYIPIPWQSLLAWWDLIFIASSSCSAHQPFQHVATPVAPRRESSNGLHSNELVDWPSNYRAQGPL